MVEKEKVQEAIELLQTAYKLQMSGELEAAIECYRRSIAAHPTAEAYTFLGWTYSFQGRYDDAIAECVKAIQVDPDFGNPYNDIGAYLIEKGQYDAAIPYLEKATEAKRYEAYHFPHCNLGRAYIAKGMLRKAAEEFQKALEIEPDYTYASKALEALANQLN